MMNKTWMATSTQQYHFIQHFMTIPCQSIKKKGKQGITIWKKEEKLSLFTGNITLHIKTQNNVWECY